jgi:ribosomal protein S18 acetylase RimI-like enzyme
MANFSQTHPAMAAKLADLIESGLNPEEIIQHFKAKDEEKAISDKEWDDVEVFPDVIHIISQALAYRSAATEDTDELHKLLCAAYQAEVQGAESFRTGEEVTKISLVELLKDPSYLWLLVEAPSGKGVERDGVILGVTCYSTDGLSRKNGVVEGHLGSVRYLAVLPRYHGYCVGRRLLDRAEQAMFEAGCCKVMACVPSTRTTMMDWLERRGYCEAGSIPYPASGLGHTLKPGSSDVELLRFIKNPPIAEDPPSKDGKPTAAWHLKTKPNVAGSAVPSGGTDEQDDAEIPDVD